MNAPAFHPHHAASASEALDRALKFADQTNGEAMARTSARTALKHLLDAFGLGHAEQALVEVLLNGQEGTGDLSTYELAHLSGDVRIEVSGELRILPLAELRTMLRKEATWRL